MVQSLKDQLMALVWRISNLQEHCAFHKSDKDAKRLLKDLKIRKKRWVEGLKRNPAHHEMLIKLRLMRRPKGEVSEQATKATEGEKVVRVTPAVVTSPDGSQVYPSERKAKNYLKANEEGMKRFLDRRGAKTL